MENVKAKAFGFLDWLRIGKLPIDTVSLNTQNVEFKIINYNNAQNYISTRGYSKYASQHDGFAVKDENGAMIFYSDGLSYSERNRVIAHEIGHVVLGHTAYSNILGHSEDPFVQSEQEREADFFALSFLAPAPVLLKMGITNEAEVSRTTGLSVKESRFAVAEILHEKEIGYSDLSTRLTDGFSGYIRDYRSRKARHFLTKAIVAISILGLLACGLWYMQSSPLPEPAQVTTPDISTISATYYVTKSGAKYHEADCHYVEDKGIPISLENAKKEGYTPCKVCDPPTE